MATDPKATIVALLVANINQGTYDITEDDNSTLAATLMAYDLPMETIKELFATNDVIITVRQDPGSSEWIGLGKAQETIPIVLDIYVVDKHTAGTQIITGTKVRWKAKDALSTLIKAKVTTAGGSIAILTKLDDVDEDMTESRPIIYHSIISTEVKILR